MTLACVAKNILALREGLYTACRIGSVEMITCSAQSIAGFVQYNLPVMIRFWFHADYAYARYLSSLPPGPPQTVKLILNYILDYLLK